MKAFKYTCAILLLTGQTVALLTADDRHIEKADESEQNDGQTFRKLYKKVKYLGAWKDCDNHITIDGSGNGCSCPFVACTGSKECITLNGFFCQFLHDNVDVNDMSRADCACKFTK
ncbi:uncharacterized protein LOC144630283 [Oculina patagonica]